MNVSGTCTVVHEQNDHGALTVRTEEATYHVVEYADEEAEREAAELSSGTTVELELSRAGRRSNVWRAERVAEPDRGR